VVSDVVVDEGIDGEPVVDLLAAALLLHAWEVVIEAFEAALHGLHEPLHEVLQVIAVAHSLTELSS